MSILATWSDKGGTGKTTLCTSLACSLADPSLALFDFDPQGDATRWAGRHGIPCEAVVGGDLRGFLRKHATSEELVVADLPPGAAGLPIAALADICVIPTRPGDADLVALGRALRQLDLAKNAGNPDLKISVVLTQARVATVRSETVDQALKEMATREGFTYLGRLSHRIQIEAAGVTGQDLLHCFDGSVAHEFRGILSGVRELLLS